MKGLSAVLLRGASIALLLSSVSPTYPATEKVLYSFCSQQPPYCTDGESPWAGVLRAKSELYATTTSGGNNGWGTLASLNLKTGVTSILYSFENYFYDAEQPEGDLIEVNGKLYGTTAGGGAGYDENGAGTVYLFDPKRGMEKVLYSFCIQQNCTNGAYPKSKLLAENGVFYGTTAVGGNNDVGCYGLYPGCGTGFSFDPDKGVEKVLHSFCAASSCADGSWPVGSLVDVNGTFYGTTVYEGNGSGCDDMERGRGTVFALDALSGTETILHTFAGELQDGGAPEADLLSENGTLYGTTEYGGSYSYCGGWDGCGTVFSIDPATGAETIVHAFKDNGRDGQNPTAALIEVKGKLYGSTQNGGAYGYGTIFSLDLKTGKEKVLYSFCSQQHCPDGANPYSGVIYVKGKLYGTTWSGGSAGETYGGGVVFSIAP